MSNKLRFALFGCAGVLLLVGLFAVMTNRGLNPEATQSTEETVPPVLSNDTEKTKTQNEVLSDDAEKTKAPDEAQDMSQTEGSGAEAGQKPKQDQAEEPERTDRSYRVYPKETPLEEIEALVEGLNYGTAAKYLIQPPDEWPSRRSEPGYALEYAEKALAEDPTSADALYVKFRLSSLEERPHYGVQFLKYESNDVRDLINVATDLDYNYPVEVVAALAPHADNEDWRLHAALGRAYARLGMREEARKHRRIFLESGPLSRYFTIDGEDFIGEEFYGKEIDLLESWPPTIWEDWNKKAASAEASQQAAPGSVSPVSIPGVESPNLQDTAPSQLPPDAPRPEGSPPAPPPGKETDMAAAYADFAKAYQDAFKMEYSLSEATPEGYMNALLGMARAFAKAGDAQRAQDAYNAVRKRHSLEEVQQAFRRFDEQERLKRQPSNEEDGEEDEEP